MVTNREENLTNPLLGTCEVLAFQINEYFDCAYKRYAIKKMNMKDKHRI